MRARSRLRRLVSIGVAAATAGAALITVQTTPASAAASPVGWSMHAGPASPIASRDNRPWIAGVEQQIGRPLAYDTRYYIFGQDQVITSREMWAKSVGKTPFIHLNMGGCFTAGCKARPTWAQVAKGTYDSYLKQQAAALIAYGSPIIFNYGNESNLKSQNRGTPTEFKNAYNHVVGVFRAAGVSNVTYALTMTNGIYDQGKGDIWYPGNATVDAIAPTGYNWACTPGQPGFGSKACEKKWRSFQQVFNGAYSYATKHGKKLLVSETGTAEDPYVPGRKALWILGMASTAKHWPALMGIVWFSAGKRVDYWNINSSPGSLAAYKCVGNDPYFGGDGLSCPGT